jgi:hypothetical protein
MDEWLFGFEKVSQHTNPKSAAERQYLLKALAGCAKDPNKIEKYKI